MFLEKMSGLLFFSESRALWIPANFLIHAPTVHGFSHFRFRSLGYSFLTAIWTFAHLNHLLHKCRRAFIHISIYPIDDFIRYIRVIDSEFKQVSGHRIPHSMDSVDKNSAHSGILCQAQPCYEIPGAIATYGYGVGSVVVLHRHVAFAVRCDAEYARYKKSLYFTDEFVSFSIHLLMRTGTSAVSHSSHCQYCSPSFQIMKCRVTF